MGSVHDALGMIQRQIKAVGKDQKSGDGKYGYNYRGVDAVTNAVHPWLGRYGVIIYPSSVSQTIEQDNSRAKPGRFVSLVVEYQVVGPDGDKLDPPIRVVGHGIDAGANAPGSALSYAYRYALLQLFSLPTDDPYADNEAQPVDDTPARATPEFVADVIARFEQLDPDKQSKLTDWVASFDTTNPPAMTVKDLSERVPGDIVHRLSSQINKALKADGQEPF